MTTEAEAHREQYCLFDTVIGPCAIAWSDKGITRVRLPEASRNATDRRMKISTGALGPSQPTAPIAEAIRAMQASISGRKVDLSALPIDWHDVDEFRRRVYAATRAVGFGKTSTYGGIAREIGSPRETREVGQALGRNPVPIIVPCHRILAKDQQLGGFSAPGGTATKSRLLELEGVRLGADAPRLPGL